MNQLPLISTCDICGEQSSKVISTICVTEPGGKQLTTFVCDKCVKQFLFILDKKIKKGKK